MDSTLAFFLFGLFPCKLAWFFLKITICNRRYIFKCLFLSIVNPSSFVSSNACYFFGGKKYIFNPCDDKAWLCWIFRGTYETSCYVKGNGSDMQADSSTQNGWSIAFGAAEDNTYCERFFAQVLLHNKISLFQKSNDLRTAWIFSGQQDMDNIATANEKREGCDGNYVDINDMNQLQPTCNKSGDWSQGLLETSGNIWNAFWDGEEFHAISASTLHLQALHPAKARQCQVPDSE